jgi:DNA-damage-inducible protein J
MAQTTLTIRIDENVKKQLEHLCGEFGMNISTAINLFAKAVIRERQIPFRIGAIEPPFMVNSKDELNAKIAQGIADLEAGRHRSAEDVFADLERKHDV